MNKKNIRQKGAKGITLIALIITIIVMLILVAVTISMAINGGLFEYAGKAVSDTQNAIDKEQELANLEANLTVDELIDKYTGGVETIPTTDSYVGYYADVDGNGTVDGIIYADLAFSVEETLWNNNSWSNYAYSAESNLKDYYVSGTYDGVFNEEGKPKEVLTATGTGNDRFYVMALKDFTTTSYSTFKWYYNASGKLDRAVATDYNDFGEGKSNTIAMLNDWNNNTATYGAQYKSDLWGVIQNSDKYDIVESENDSGKWFVPSKAEWSAFGDYLYTKLGVTTSNYSTYGLSNYYWSSSQRGTYNAYDAHFYDGFINNIIVNATTHVRMSATF